MPPAAESIVARSPHARSPGVGQAGHDATADVLELAPPQAVWSVRYRVEAEVLRVALASLSPQIEHVGSTAVPGLAAVPVIDIAVGVADPVAVDALAGRLSNFGYELMLDSGHRAPNRRVLMRIVRGVRTHHVHVVRIDSDAWHRLLMFRDLLRRDADLARNYESLKRQLAQQARGRALLYETGKADFVASVIGHPAFSAAA